MRGSHGLTAMERGSGAILYFRLKLFLVLLAVVAVVLVVHRNKLVCPKSERMPEEHGLCVCLHSFGVLVFLIRSIAVVVFVVTAAAATTAYLCAFIRHRL